MLHGKLIFQQRPSSLLLNRAKFTQLSCHYLHASIHTVPDDNKVDDSNSIIATRRRSKSIDHRRSSNNRWHTCFPIQQRRHLCTHVSLRSSIYHQCDKNNTRMKYDCHFPQNIKRFFSNPTNNHISDDKNKQHDDLIINPNNRQVDIRGNIPNGGNGISVDQYAEVRRIFTISDVEEYATLISDFNPIHSNSNGVYSSTNDDTSTQTTSIKDGGVVVHGMLVSSLFSCIFGTLIPGSVYRSQNLQFRAPVFANDVVLGQVKVIRVKKLRIGGGGGFGSLVSCDTSVLVMDGDDEAASCHDGRVCITGKAEVWLPGVICG